MKTVNHITNNNGLLKINLNNLSYNYNFLRKQVKPSRVASVLKSNCYGLGLDRVTKKLVNLGCKDFFLTSYEEAFALKKLIVKGNIFLLNGLIGQTESKIFNIFKYKIIPVINSFDELKTFYKFSKKFNISHKLTLHFDTGINRIGIDPNEKNDVIDFCRKKKINIFCVMSHLMSSNEKKSRFNIIQKKKFESIIKFFPNSLHSLSNSNAILNFKEFNFSLVRSGGCIFGTGNNKYIKNVIEFFGKVLQVRYFDENHQSFGYNATFQTYKKKKVAILGVGYADGYPRSLSNNSYAFFKKKKLPIIGSISMDYTIVDISTLQDNKVKTGDWMELIGNNISLEEVSSKAGTIPYEILNSVGNRVKKTYIG